jgi:hypothetical protein
VEVAVVPAGDARAVFTAKIGLALAQHDRALLGYWGAGRTYLAASRPSSCCKAKIDV